ncbi:MAG: hypothetical protein AB7O97_05465 [Planctomycetota bacterium]
MANSPVSSLRMILWPSVLTLLVGIARLVAELQGWTTRQTGGALAPLGIVWLGFAFGGWFAWRLGRLGHGAPTRRRWIPALIALLVIVAVVGSQFAGVDRQDRSEAAFAALRHTVLLLCGVAIAAALLAAWAWPRLAWVMLLYAIPARLTVVAMTVLARQQGWDTHHVKFGPAGIEVPMADTAISATVAQLGFWVPFTVVSGVLVGTAFAGLFGQRAPAGD